MISFPASEAAAKGLELDAAKRAQGPSTASSWPVAEPKPAPDPEPPDPEPSLLASAAHLLKRGYERVCSAIFDPDGDCMRF